MNNDVMVEWRRSDFKEPFSRDTFSDSNPYPYSGGECPACDDSNSDVDTIVDGSPEDLSFRVTCHTCGTTWDEEYALKEVRVTVPPKFQTTGPLGAGYIERLREAWQESHGL
tara:strand:- start:67 stop:402 length:336 start_codon:yes stop_codon:yes gene_type:complete